MSPSFSPTNPRRLSTSETNAGGGAHSAQEDLINAFEAEEERIINLLSRKLEQLRDEKISLENVLEAESESHVNRLSRELSALRAQSQNPSVNGHSHTSSSEFIGDVRMDTMLDTLQRENEQLRNRLVDTERDYVRIYRLNEIYREELIEHRKRLGIPIDNIIGLSSTDLDPLSRPIHRRPSNSSIVSPLSAMHAPRPSLGVPIPHGAGVPIPRPPSQIHRPSNNVSLGNTPLSHSPSSSSSAVDSPASFVLSPTNPASYVSAITTLTSPPSSTSFNAATFGIGATPQRGLSYPSVPPPSLSSSFGSPNISYHVSQDRDASISPVEPLSRRNSHARRGSFERRVVEAGSLRSISQSQSRRASVERGGRVAETGTLVPRSRAASTTSRNPLPSTQESETEADSMDLGDV